MRLTLSIKITNLKLAIIASIGLLIVLASSSFSATAEQTLISDPRFATVNSDKGLNQNTINSLLLDRQGFLWIATDEGLSRFDSNELLEIHGQSGELTNNPVNKVFEDSQGRLWLSTVGQGVFIYDKFADKITELPKQYYSLTDGWVQGAESLHALNEKEILVAYHEKIIAYDMLTLSERLVFELSADDIDKERWIRASLIEQGVLFVATNQGLISVDLETNTSIEIDFIQELNEVNPLTIDTKSLLVRNKQELLIGTVSGLYTMPFGALVKHVTQGWERPRSAILNETRNIWSMTSSVNGLTYIGTDIGVYELDADNNLIFLFEPKASDMEISDKRIRSMVTDNKGNLWFGTEYNGALFWNRSSLIFSNIYNRTDTPKGLRLSDNNILTLHQNESDTLWLGTNNGLTKISLSEGTTKQFLVQDFSASLYSDSNISQIESVGSENLWLMTGESLRKFNIKEQRFVDLPVNPRQANNWQGQYIWGMAKQNNQFIWGLFDKGFYRIDTQTGFGKHFPVDENVYPLSVMLSIIKFDKKSKQLIIAAYGATIGLNVETGAFTLIHSAEKTLQTEILPQSYLRDNDNNVWISYPRKGLFKLDGDTYQELRHFTTDENLPSNLIYELKQDELGNLWFSSHSGIHMMDSQTSLVYNYNNLNGIGSSEFNAGASYILADGRFVFGGTKGITIFSANEARQIYQGAAISPVITELRLASENLSRAVYASNEENIELKHNDYGLKIYFSTLNFSSMNNSRYVFELSSSANTIKYPPTANNFIHLPSLTPGDYILSAYSLSGQEQNSPATKLFISVKHSPWLSPFAYTLYCFVVVLVLGTYLYKRLRYQRRLAAANEKITTYNSRLTSALKASQSDIWEWRSGSNLIQSPRFYQELGYDSKDDKLKFEEHIKLMHESERLQYLNAWRQFIRGGSEQFDHTYRMLSASGEYLWFRDSGSINPNANTNEIVVTGTYTNVTEALASKERLKLFGDAFAHTRDWVLIFNKDRIPLAANSSFMKAFEIDSNTNLRHALNHIFEKQDTLRNNLYMRLLSLKPNDTFKTEITVTLHSRKVTLITDINTIVEEDNPSEVQHYLVIMTDITEQKEAQYALQRLANYDVLTGLINRNLLIDRLEQSIKSAKRHDTRIAVFFVDLDRFKPINDTFGHEAGDRVLVEISNRLQHRFREQDSVARLGGDEFVVVLEEIDAIDSVNKIAAALLFDIEKAIHINNQSISISASVGISLFPDDGSDAESMLRNADVAMYNAKQMGKNRFQHYTANMNVKVQQDMLLQNKVKVAVIHDEFENYYQPIIDIKNNTTAGFEMLMRWNSDGEFIPPDIFIPITEQLDLIKELTMTAIEKVVEDLSVWYANGFDGYVAVNLSAKQFSTRPDFERILRMLSKRSLPTSSLRFEITEGLLIDDNSNTIDYMTEMRKFGFKIALDDFGTGYSSLKYLKDFPIDVLKIDKSFVDEIGRDEGTESIVKSTLIMTKMLSMDTVAEGIESESQLTYFMQGDCRYLQGYFFSKPVKAAMAGEILLKKWLETSRYQLNDVKQTGLTG